MTSPYSLIGANLIELGYVAIPIMPGTKSPGEVIGGRWCRMRNWTARYSSRPPSISQVNSWSDLPDAGVGVLTGRISSKLTGVDLDVDEIVDAVTRALPETPCIKQGAKGRTLMFRSDLPNSAFNRPLPDGRRERMVDILSDGRQTVLPPTIHPDINRPYRWLGDPLDQIPPDQLPLLPADTFAILEDVLEFYGYDKNKDPHTHAVISGKGPKLHIPENYEERSSWQQVNALAWAKPECWIDALHLYNIAKTPWGYEAVADWRPSGDNTPIFDRKRNLKINFDKHTIVDFGDGPKGYDPINLVNAVRGQGKSEAWYWLSERVGYYENPVKTDGLTVSVKQIAPDLKQEELKLAESKRQPWETDIPLWQVPGLVGRLTQFILDTAMYQQPMFSLAASLAIVGSCCGRHILGPTGSSTLIYSMCVGPSACGKEHPIKAIDQILLATQLNRLRGPSSFTSYSAVVNTVIKKPSCVAVIDEIGAFLSKGKGKNSASYEKQIFAFIRSQWSKGNGTLPTEERAQQESITLHFPHMGLYGASTVGELFESLTSTDMTGGLMNRFLVFQNREYPDPSEPLYKLKDIPPDLVEAVLAVANRPHDAADRQHSLGDQELPSDPFELPWDSPEVKAYYKEREQAVRMMMKENQKLSDLLSRAIEYAVRLATIRAVGINVDNPRVTMEDFKWGEAVSMQCFMSLAKDVDDHMAAGLNDVDNKKVRRAAREIENQNGGWFQVRDIQRRSAARPLRAEQIDKILAYYMELGEVVVEDRTDTAKHSSRRKFFRFIR